MKVKREESIVRVIGGLGNQMFQYAFYLLMQKKTGLVKLDVSDYGNYTLHNGLELARVFNCVGEGMLANEEELKVKKDDRAWRRVRKWLGKLFFRNPNHFIKKTHFIEPHSSKFIENVEALAGKYLDGYWQNEKYFLGFRHELLERFHWQGLKPENLDLAQKMKQQNSVALHIRRLDQPKSIVEWFYRLKLQISYRACSKFFYLNAVDRMKKELSNPVFYVFTDNIKWVRKNLDLGGNAVVVDWNRGEDSYQDMYLMSQCRHNIISASSFSWWGAWMNKNPEKIVIAPKKWMNRLQKTEYIIPAKWQKI
ncbi:alpha-1,2-fucosyltransferase [Pontiellaceae bacterium B12219]|nr:alpha-1,2-fucosyltransferase [Pontiellaceae bacterium B12219]